MEEQSSQERYVSICFLSESHSADQLCSTLEAAGIPVIIQHLAIGGESRLSVNGGGNDAQGFPQTAHGSDLWLNAAGDVTALGFRLLVPIQHAQMALKLWERYSHQRRHAGVEQPHSESLAAHATKATRKAA